MLLPIQNVCFVNEDENIPSSLRESAKSIETTQLSKVFPNAYDGVAPI